MSSLSWIHILFLWTEFSFLHFISSLCLLPWNITVFLFSSFWGSSLFLRTGKLFKLCLGFVPWLWWGSFNWSSRVEGFPQRKPGQWSPPQDTFLWRTLCVLWDGVATSQNSLRSLSLYSAATCTALPGLPQTCDDVCFLFEHITSSCSYWPLRPRTTHH